MDRAIRAAKKRVAQKNAAARKYARGVSSNITAKPARKGPTRSKAPFRRTFDSAKGAADVFYSENIDFLLPIIEFGEPREAVREWLRSNHGKTGRMRVKDSSQTPWAKKIIDASDPVRAALTNIFSHANGRRWDRVDWDSVRALGESLLESATDSAPAGVQGWYWFPVATEDDEAKILDRLSVEGDMDAYRRFAESLSKKEVERVEARYDDEIRRLAKCMPADRKKRVAARLEEIRAWKDKGIPESVCGQKVYAGHTCDLEPIHLELQRLRDACQSDAAFVAWLNESVRRSPRAGSVAEDLEEEPVDIVPVSAYEGDAPAAPAPEDCCTPTRAAKVMGKLAAAKRRENNAKRRKVREANAAQRRVEREKASARRKAERESRRRKTGKSAKKPEDLGTKVKPRSGKALTHEERLAIGGDQRDKALYEKHGRTRIGKLVVDYIDGSITNAENRELEALGLAKNDALTDDGWVLYQSIKGKGDPKAAPATSTTGAWTFYTGWAPKHFRDNGFATMVRDPLSSEEKPDRKAKMKRWGVAPHLAIKKLDKSKLAAEILRDLPSIEPATLHKIALTTFGLAGDVAHGTKVEEALWDLVEAGEVEHTLSTMLGSKSERAAAKFDFVLFRTRGSKKNPSAALEKAYAERKQRVAGAPETKTGTSAAKAAEGCGCSSKARSGGSGRSCGCASKAGTGVPVLEVFDADVMRQVKPKHVAKVIKVLVEKERLLPPGHSLSARTPREGVVYLSARARKLDVDGVNAGMRRLFPDYNERELGQQELHLVPGGFAGRDAVKTISSQYADSLRTLALREAGVDTSETTVIDQAAPAVSDKPIRPAEPKKCGSEWCAEVLGEIQPGDPIRVSTRRGKQWDAVVTEVVKTYTKRAKGLRTGGLRSVVRSEKLPPALLRGRPVDMLSAEGRPSQSSAQAPDFSSLKFFGRDKDSVDKQMTRAQGVQVLNGGAPPPWAVYVFAYPRVFNLGRVRGNGGPRAEIYGPQGLRVHMERSLSRLSKAGYQFEPGEEKMLHALQSVTLPKAKPPTKPGTQGSLVKPEQEGFALTHPKGTAAVHGRSAGTGGTQSVLPGVSRKVSAEKMAEIKAREAAEKAASPWPEVRLTVLPKRTKRVSVGLDEYPDLEGTPRSKLVAVDAGYSTAYVVPLEEGDARGDTRDAWVPAKPSDAERYGVYVGDRRLFSGYVDRDYTGSFTGWPAEFSGSGWNRKAAGIRRSGRPFDNLYQAVMHVVRST